MHTREASWRLAACSFFVGARVGNAKSNDPSLIEPVTLQ
jgi:hypothetical protein